MCTGLKIIKALLTRCMYETKLKFSINTLYQEDSHQPCKCTNTFL